MIFKGAINPFTHDYISAIWSATVEKNLLKIPQLRGKPLLYIIFKLIKCTLRTKKFQLSPQASKV